MLEVLAHAADEAGCAGRAEVTLHADGSVTIADDGRGTDTRRDAHGRPVKKPVMATPDLRFFDHPNAQTLSDGPPGVGSQSLPRSPLGSCTRTGGSTAPGVSDTRRAFQ
jgi:topoisomerase-4 subunit B